MFGNKRPKPVPLRLVHISDAITLQSLRGYWVVRFSYKNSEGNISEDTFTYAGLKQALSEVFKLSPNESMDEVVTLLKDSPYLLKQEREFLNQGA